MSLSGLLPRTLRLTVPLYLSSLILALIPAGLAMLGFWQLAGSRPWRVELLGPNWLNLLMDAFSSVLAGYPSSGVALLAATAFLVAPLFGLIQVFVYSYLAGGILEGLLAGEHQRVAFWPACRRWFGPFVRLGVLGVSLLLILGLLVGGLCELIVSYIGRDVSIAIQLLIQAILLGWLELARAVMVRDGQTSARRVLRDAIPGCASPRALALWLLLGGLQGGLILLAISPPAVTDAFSVTDLVIALVFGQAIAYLAAWLKVARLAVAAHLALSTRPKLASAPPA